MIVNTAEKHANFYNLAWYGIDKEPERSDWVAYKNLVANDHHRAVKEMEKVASHSRCEKPTFHVMISWDPDDDVTPEIMADTADEFLDHIGLGENQALIMAHNDTDHPHVHIMANRVYPRGHEKEYTAWEEWDYNGKGRDRTVDKSFYEKAEEFLREKEIAMGWRVVPGKHYEVPGHEFANDYGGRRPKDHEYHQQEKAKKVASGIGVDPDSVDGRSIIEKCEEIKEELWAVHDKGKEGSFKEFDQVLDKRGLWIDMARNEKGMVIFDGQFHVKASEVQRKWSGPNLEEVFGESLKDYINAREESLSEQQGITLAMDWKEALDEKDRQILNKVLVSQIPRMQKKVRNLKEMNQEYNKRLESLEGEINELVSQGYNNKSEATANIKAFLKEHQGDRPNEKIQEALYENPSQFGEVRDQKEVQWLAEAFGDVEKLKGEYGSYFTGENRKERIKEIRNMEKVLKEKQSLQATIKGKLGAKARQKMAEGSEAGKAMSDAYNKSLMLYRATNTIWRYFVKDKPMGRNVDLDKEMGKALAGINESINKTYENPVQVKEIFNEIAWNDYKNPKEGVDIIADLEKRPSKFGTVSDHVEAEILAERLRKPEQIREKFSEFLTSLGDIGEIDEETGQKVWRGPWLVWRENEAPSLNFERYEGSTQTIDQLLDRNKDFMGKVEEMDIPDELRMIISKRDEGVPLDEIFADHEAFIRRQGTPKDLIGYFKELPEVLEREPESVGGLSVAQEMNRWLGRGMSGTEGGRMLAKATQIGFKLAKSLSRMLSSSSKVGRAGMRAVIKDSVSITKINSLEQAYGVSKPKAKDKGRGEGMSR